MCSPGVITANNLNKTLMIEMMMMTTMMMMTKGFQKRLAYRVLHGGLQVCLKEPGGACLWREGGGGEKRGPGGGLTAGLEGGLQEGVQGGGLQGSLQREPTGGVRRVPGPFLMKSKHVRTPDAQERHAVEERHC